ncbi:pentapeptide repeat-containing protein [Nocardia sp. NPDC057668]|uniref:WD40 domain-containing protein n=1 Tax=Nocardia sp. NPDC057668 TaxID=3346202 RepID=UPI00366BF4F1
MTVAGGWPRDFFISYSPADERWAAWLAWQLESAGARYRVLLHSWDFAAGESYEDFTRQGLRESAAVVAVFSHNYLDSRDCAAERRAVAALDPAKVLAVRVDDCAPADFAPHTEFLDLADARSEDTARRQLLERAARLPARSGPAAPPTGSGHDARPEAAVGRRPLTAPDFPGGSGPAAPRTGLSILHLPGPRFGRGLAAAGQPRDPAGLQSHVWGAVSELLDREPGVPTPDLLVVSGDLTESGHPAEVRQAISFLGGLRVLLKLAPDRVVVVPGNHDVSTLACHSYFLDCAANDRRPLPPYFPKLGHFAQLFTTLYRGLDQLVFDVGQPYTLFPVPELHVVVAGLNSTMAATHLADSDYGSVGEEQLNWFAERLRDFEKRGWLRVGVVRHAAVSHSSASPYDPALLRDAPKLAAALGPRLNLLLHGPGPDGAHTRRLGGALPVLAAEPDRPELIHITAGGLLRLPCAPVAEKPVFWLEPWARCAAAFGPDEPDRPAPAPQTAPGPDEQLLDSVREICAVKFPDAKIRRSATEHPYLLITEERGRVIDQRRIGVHVGEVTEAVLDRFLRGQPEPGSELVYRGPRPTPEVRERAAADGVRVRSFSDFQGLLDLDDYLRKQAEQLRNDPRYPPGLYVPQRFRMVEPGAQEIRDDLIGTLMRLVTGDDGRFVLLLGDFGRGKTFALRELARRIGETQPTLLPLFIELRTLDRTRSVHTLVAAHLADNGEDRIDLGALDYLLEQGRVVLLFDGFDELLSRLSYESAADHMDTLLQAAVGRAKVVVAARTQHFKSRDQVSGALGRRFDELSGRRVINIEDFTPDQVRSFLVNRASLMPDVGAGPPPEDRMRLLRGIPDLLAMARNPRMLSFIAEIDEHRLRAAAGSGQLIGPTRLYREILESWLTYEVERSPEQAGAQTGLRVEELWQAITAFALRVWEAGEPYLTLAELTDVAREVDDLTDPGRRSAPLSAHIIGSRSLLVRAEDNLFGFIHPSVADWLVAKHVSVEFAAGASAPPPLEQAELTPLGIEFLCDLTDLGLLRAWIRRVLEDPAAHDIARHNAERITARLRTAPDTPLRGIDLGEQDLSYRDLRRADLTGAVLRRTRLFEATLDGAVLAGADATGADLEQAALAGADLRGADLTEAHLIGADLRNADLRDARLHRARLDRASLIGADLRGADLTEAQLIGADLRNADLRNARLHRAQLDQASLIGANLCQADLTGARLARTNLTATLRHGTVWTRAALLEVIGLPARTELTGSARVPGTPPGTEFAPAAVGVMHGFDTRHGRLPRPLAYSPDGGVLALGCDYGGVVIYGADTGRVLRTLQGHRARAFAVAYTAQVLVTGSADNTVRIWDATTGEALRILSDHEKWPWPLEVNVTGDQLATGDADGVLRLWSLPAGELRYRFAAPRGQRQRIVSIAFHGDQVAAGYQDGTVRIFRVHTGTETGTFRAQTDSLRRVAWDPTGRLLAVCGADGVLALWDPAGCRPVRELPGHRDIVYTLAFHPTEPLLASGDTAGGIMLWRLDTGAVLHTGAEHGTAPIHWLAFESSGDLLASGDATGSILVRDGRTGAPRHRLTGHTGSIWPFVFRPDGGQLAVADDQFALRVWDPVTGECRHVLTGHGRHVRTVSFDATGAVLAACGNDGDVRLWDAATGRLTEHLRGDADRPVNLESAIFNPARPGQLTTTGNDGRLSVFDIGTATHERHISIDAAPVWATAYSPDGRLVTTANDDDSVTMWTRNTGGEHAVCRDHRGRVRSIAFDAAGARMATGCDDSEVRVWDVASGTLLHTLRGHRDRVYGVAFHGDRLASVSWDAEVRIWDIGGGATVHRLTRHGGKLWCVAIDPRTGMLATAGDDLAIHLWDITSGRHLHTLTGHRYRVRSLAFARTGGLLASGGNDGSVMLWSCGADDAPPAQRATLLGWPEGWAAFTPDGRYKTEGLTDGQFWHVIGMRRFEAGELNSYLPQIRQLELDEPL